MAVKLAFAAGLFCVVFFMFGSSKAVPDDVVYTEVKKTLVNGTTSILRCRFKGLPNAVYWKKGSDPVTSPSIIIWSYGEKSGPRYEDGSCDIDGNYSLVIRNVRNTDAGRYICRVSNYKGILKYNYTDVMITNSAVRTEQSVAVQKGEVSVLPCQVNIRPRRVSWVRGANDTLVSMDLSRSVVDRSGPGYEEGLFNITSEYSLVINDVKILHEDSYFCEVTDFDTGDLFRNVTRLNVFAFPLEPFPSIEECPREQQDLSSCTLRVASQTTLTCEVREYYPVIDLFFMHGSLRVDSLETRVWNNSDGTKNKRITVATNDTSDAVYECVAKGLVGKAESRSMTIHLIRNVQQTRVALAVVVPAILVSTIIVIAVCVIQRRKRHLKQKYGKVPMAPKDPKEKQRDLISYIELWKLVKYAREENLSDELGKALDKLIKGEESSKTLQTDEDYYKEFCQWKAGYTGTCQRKDFFDACRSAGLESTIEELQKYSDSTQAVAVDDLEHSLWHIAESGSVIGLLEDLGAPHERLEVLKHKEKREVVERAMNILKLWRDDNNTGNQEVMLSLALETIPSDQDFFQIPKCQKHGLDKNEIQAFLVPQITSRHCTELIDAVMDFRKKYRQAVKWLDTKSEDIWMDNIIEQNRTDLFDSHQMIEDWWAEQNCSNYEKRCRLWRAANVLKGTGDNSDVPNAGVQITDRTDSRCEKSEIKANQGPLSPPKRGFIYKAELVDIARDLIMEEFRPLADFLGIERTKFTSYRQEFCVSHLKIGTISLVLQLYKMVEGISIGEVRPDVCSIFDKAGYPKVIKWLIYASEPSFGELFAIATAVTQDDEPDDVADTPESSEDSKQAKESTNETVVQTEQSPSNDGEKAKELHTGHQETPRSGAALTSINVEETKRVPKSNISPQTVSDLQRILELTDEDIPDSNMASVLTLLKIWKDRVCSGLIDKRVVLAKDLQKINKPHLVAAVVNGRYQSRETSKAFIEDMLDGMDEYRRTSLERLLKSKQDKKKGLQSPDTMSQWIYDWVADWTKDMKGIKIIARVNKTPEKHRNFNDKLVDHGFLDLAREIMNIEQLL